ncbi:nesprin-1-like [Babylonia areolata]|uniref:nesprin-1-like n=1 Tax=Babylonia areolata TaxID=304850 RepID=UPI003FD62A2D
MAGDLHTFLSTLDKALQRDADTPLTAHTHVQVLLKKCKMYRVDLTSKQRTMQAVQASLQQTAPPLSTGSHDAQEHAEMVAQLARRWTKVFGSVTDRLQYLERLSGQWSALDAAASEALTWMTQQEAQLTACRHPAPYESAVHLAQKECKAIQAQLVARGEEDVQRAQVLADQVLQLMDPRSHPEGRGSVGQTLSSMQQRLEGLQRQGKETEGVLEEMAGGWGRYQALMHSLTQSATLARHTLSRCLSRVQGTDVDSLAWQVERLQTLQQELDAQRGDLDALNSHADALSEKLSEGRGRGGATPQDVQTAASALTSTWQTLTTDLSDRLHKFRSCLDAWREYEAGLDRVGREVEAKEGQCKEVMGVSGGGADAAEESLKKCEALQQDVDTLLTTLTATAQPGTDLTSLMGPSTVARLTSKTSALEVRLKTLSQHLSGHTQDLQGELSLLRQLQGGCEVLEKVLEGSEEVLGEEEEEGGDAFVEESQLQERLERLREVLVQFQNSTDTLNTTNALSHRVALTSGESSRLLQLNRRWHQGQADFQARCSAVQRHLVARQTFAAKCQSWGQVVARAEDLLAPPVAGDLRGLLEQQRLCQAFEDDLFSRQQVLQAVVSHGQAMLEAGQVESPAERETLHHSLQAMLQQWQSVTCTAQQRKAVINSMVLRWLMFQTMTERLSLWLGEKGEEVGGVEAASPSLQQLGSLSDRVKRIQRDFGHEEEKRGKVKELAAALMSEADSRAVEDVRKTTERLENMWVQVQDQTEKQRQRLQELEERWARGEELTEQVQCLLREQRHIMAGSIPENYDDLKDTLLREQKFMVDVLHPARELEELKRVEVWLKESLRDDEDMDVLHQRVLMLCKLWADLLSMAQRRQERLTEAMSRWTLLEGRIEGLVSWMEGTERELEAFAQDCVTEDLLKKLQMEYAELMTSKGKEVEEVTSEGRHLMTLSNDVMATHLQHLLQSLQDRWRSLQDTLESRRHKLQTTMDSLSLLDRQLKDLNLWLSGMEEKLTAPLVFHQFSTQEVQRLLQQTQELQQDLADHSKEVGSVQELCERLLADPQSCTTHTEVTTLQQARTTLQDHWTRITDLAAERRTRIEETGELWDKFQADWEDFSSWLKGMEGEVDEASAAMPAAVTTEDNRKYETLQQRLLERLKDLEDLNKQYHRLFKEGRTDSQGDMQGRWQEVNERWDGVQGKMTAMLEALRRSAGAYEDLMSTQRSVVSWLRDLDGQVTLLERPGEGRVEGSLEARLKEIERIEEELAGEAHRLENVKEGASVVLQQMSVDGGERVQRAVEEVEGLYNQVQGHGRDCRHRLLQAMTAAGEEESPQQTPKSSEILAADTEAAPPPHLAEPEESGAGAGDRSATVDVLLEQLREAITEATLSLEEAERLVESLAPSGGTLGEAQSQSLLQCKVKVTKVQKLHQLLLREAGTTTFPDEEKQVNGVFDRWNRLQSRAEDLGLRVSHRQKDVGKFSADVDALRGWVEEAEALQASHHPLPTDLLQLKVLIRQHRDFMAQLEEKRPHFSSIQLLKDFYIQPATPEGRDLQTRVADLEQHWDGVSDRAANTQQALQVALLQCQEFHHHMHDYLLWLEGLEGRVQACEPVVLTDDLTVLQEKYTELKAVYGELEQKQPAVLALRETVDQLLLASNESREMGAARERMYVISSRLQALLHKTGGYLRLLETKLGGKSSSAATREGRLPPMVHPLPYSRRRSPFTYFRQLLFGEPSVSVPDETDSANLLMGTEVAPCTAATHLATRPSLLRRVLWTALPLQLLLLLLLGIACLLPVCEEDDRCQLVNNFRRSFFPMLYYSQGTPPS